MEFKKKVSRITAFVNRNISKEILDSLKEVGVIDLHLAAARSPVIEERKGIFALLPGRDLVDDPLDIISFLVARKAGDSILNLIIEKGQLNLPGRGSVYSEEIDLGMAHELCQENKPDPFEIEKAPLHKLTGICCVVQRGQGDSIARVALDTGICVPSLHFGVGTGVRDKMGILRITIPAEKEVINIATSPFDAEIVMKMMIEVGKLDQPGKGFIYLYPLEQGIINMKVTRGEHRHAASIEQIVAAVDHIKGGAEWRRRSGTVEKTREKSMDYLTDLVDLTLLCDGGTGTDLVNVAMSAGAPGATIARLKHVRPQDSPLSEVSPAREACSMIVSNNEVESILNALEEADAFADCCHGQIQLRRVQKAFTYFGK
jgi:nitrogen regulatory protein PII